MNKPIVKIGYPEDRAPCTIELTSEQHAALSLALQFFIERIEQKEYALLEAATVEGIARIRTTLFGIQAQLRCAQADAELER